MKAQFLNKFGVDLPFDRHDWFVDRCGKEIRYIIDYHSNKNENSINNNNNKHNNHNSVVIDARPDMYRFSNIMDRFVVQYKRAMQKWRLNKLQENGIHVNNNNNNNVDDGLKSNNSTIPNSGNPHH